MVKCPKCGHDNPNSAKGCGKCGADLTNADKKASNAKFLNNTLIIAGIAIVLIIAIVGVLASGMLTSDNTANVDSSQSVAPIVDNGTSDTSTQESSSQDSSTEYWASSKTDKFHLPSCEWAQKINEANKIVYHSRDDAIADGKQPCSVCNP